MRPDAVVPNALIPAQAREYQMGRDYHIPGLPVCCIIMTFPLLSSSPGRPSSSFLNKHDSKV